MKPVLETKQGAWFLPYDPTPSPEDYEMTTRLKEAGKLLSVELLDHMIIGDYCHFSLAEQGFI